MVVVAPEMSFFFNQKVLIFFLFLRGNMFCGSHEKQLTEACLMSSQNMCFYGEKIKNIYLILPVIWSYE